jgi:hypothetical protein
MDNRDVSRAIRAVIRPLLRQHGFVQFSERSAWRDGAGVIHVVNFPSPGYDRAVAAGYASHPLAVNLGVYYPDVPKEAGQRPVRQHRGWPLPAEYESHIRRWLRPSFNQLQAAGYGHLWYIDPGGNNVADVLDDVVMHLECDAFPWFERWSDLPSVVQWLRTSDAVPDGTFARGANPSPSRSYLIGYLARATGDIATASRYLLDALEWYHLLATDGDWHSRRVWLPVVEQLARDWRDLVLGNHPHPSAAGS